MPINNELCIIDFLVRFPFLVSATERVYPDGSFPNCEKLLKKGKVFHTCSEKRNNIGNKIYNSVTEVEKVLTIRGGGILDT